MARRGTSKRKSVEQEDFLAKLFNGKRSKSSGAAEHDAGDVRCTRLLIEAKVTGGPTAIESKPVPKFVRLLEKIAEEAYQEGRDPMLALRYYDPNSILSGSEGWIDVSVMLASDLAVREEAWLSSTEAK